MVLDGLALPQTDLVCNLGILLLKKWVVIMVRKAFTPLHVVHKLHAFLVRVLGASHFSVCFTWGILKENLEGSACAKFSSISSYACL